MSEGRGVKCNNCGSRVVPSIESKTEGKLEYNYFTCPFCGTKYLVSVTDDALRENVNKYLRLAMRNRESRLSERAQKRLQELKASNLKRARELREQHPLEGFNPLEVRS